jgi:hypothetical protein
MSRSLKTGKRVPLLVFVCFNLLLDLMMGILSADWERSEGLVHYWRSGSGMDVNSDGMPRLDSWDSADGDDYEINTYIWLKNIKRHLSQSTLHGNAMLLATTNVTCSRFPHLRLPWVHRLHQCQARSAKLSYLSHTSINT